MYNTVYIEQKSHTVYYISYLVYMYIVVILINETGTDVYENGSGHTCGGEGAVGAVGRCTLQLAVPTQYSLAPGQNPEIKIKWPFFIRVHRAIITMSVYIMYMYAGIYEKYR